ncbi:hypothetical protein [Dyadobacter arcticus]|uniref:Beta-lactamase-inhibitor-like PepSY-like domain-containing protein n=1 Tax=Dyadobacter arcticus TaxID=1078754 RepID=A0ABX0USC6_9BACT|nr:hypothetical protein [Dyadobacter arcticus]NIJ55878.1 hypothetical protein [Dyadobacter arcticus]
MKRTILAIALLALTGSALSAKPLQAYLISQYNDADKVAVRPEDLPEALKSTLAAEYPEWKVSSAFLVIRENNAQYYEVNIKKGEESTTLNLDKYGKKLD